MCMRYAREKYCVCLCMMMMTMMTATDQRLHDLTVVDVLYKNRFYIHGV